MATVDKTTGELSGYSFDPSAVKAKKLLNVPVLSQKSTGSVYVTFLSHMFIGKEMANPKPDEKTKGPATIAFVVDLVTGDVKQLLLSTVQIGTLNENYPDYSYIDKSFQLVNLGKRTGKDYNDVQVIEIDTPSGIDLTGLKTKVVIPARPTAAARNAAPVPTEPTTTKEGK